MSRIRIPRARGCIGAARPRSAGAAPPPVGEPVAYITNVGRSLIHDVLGDLAEERAHRCVHDGPISATWWYGREIARSAPHMAVESLRSALRTSRGRAAIAGAASAVAATLIALGVSLASRAVPARLSLGQNDTVIVNNERPARIPVHVLDSTGATLDADASDVTFDAVSRGGVAVTRDGEVSCEHPGTARVSVSRGALSRSFVVQCAPVHALSFDAADQFLVAGGLPEPFAIRGVAPDSTPVTRMVGSVTVDDSDIASIDGRFLRPHRAGTTTVRLEIGDRYDAERVTVHEAAVSPSRIDVDQVYSRDLSIAPGGELQWPVAHGRYTIWIRPPAGEGQSPLHLMLQNFNCVEPAGQRYLCVALSGATLRVIAPSGKNTARLVSRLTVARYRN